ncbi:hypothetical protein F2Q68_00000155 [Brassica cretica]|uniref:Anthranilate synthase component I N-terminal domain-containing protein n=1 Tax=Brassica cretica TaxID=69181 RepID=A0A8S9JIW6_BRACR|nr:hypothetical protein F2Q68_00000155 [Brassica cretica]
MSSSMNVAKVKPLSFSRRLVPSAVSRGLASSVTVSGYSGRSSAYAPSLRSIKCVSVSPEASIVSDTKKHADASKSTNLVPIYRCIFSDQLTPVLAYRCLVKEDDREAPSFLFESVEPGSQMSSVGRYSVVGAQPAMEIVAKEDKVIVMDHKSGSLTEEYASARLTSVSLALLGLSALFSDVAFYWVVLIFFLQRGPIAPLAEEITEPEEKFVYLGILVLFLSLLVCLPYPFPFTGEDAMMIGL